MAPRVGVIQDAGGYAARRSRVVCPAPRILTLEGPIEVEDVGEIVARVGRLAEEESEIDEGEHDIADVGGAAHTPVVQDDPRGQAEALEGEVAAGFGQLTPADVPPFRESGLRVLERLEHE